SSKRDWGSDVCSSDLLGFAQKLSQEFGVEFGGCEEYPTLENAALAAGYDAVSFTPCDMGTAMVERFHELGVKYLCCRSIGFDHEIGRAPWRASAPTVG